MNLVRKNTVDNTAKGNHYTKGAEQFYPIEKQLPIAIMTFHLNTSVYRQQGNDLIKIENERIAKDTVEPVVAFQEDGNVAELTGGRFIKDVLHQNPTIDYGIVKVFGEEARVCTRNGIVQRKLCRNQRLKVKSVTELDNGVFLYGIGKNEYITSLEPIQFIKGYVVLDKAITISADATVSLLAGKPYAFSHFKEGKVFLTDVHSWLDIRNLSCSIDYQSNQYLLQ